MGPQLTTANKILIAAGQLDEERDTFTAEDLIVKSWQMFPESFGLSGYGEKYPDSNRVLAKLMGSVGLCNRGWLEQVSTKTYKMTPSGRKFMLALRAHANDPTNAPPKPPKPPAARKTDPPATEKPRAAAKSDGRSTPISSPEHTHVAAPRASRASAPPPAAPGRPVSAPPPRAPSAPPPTTTRPVAPAPTVARSQTLARSAPAVAKPSASDSRGGSDFDGTAQLQRLLSSVASQKWARGTNVTFQDACAFWGITSSLHPTQLPTRIEEVEDLLGRAVKRIQDSKTAIQINDRTSANLSQLIGLQGLHRTMTQKYRRELDSLKARLAETN